MTVKLFLHLPKTGGTSFRKSVFDCFGRESVVCDYGEDQPDTSDSVVESVYAKRDSSLINQAIASSDAVMVCGHVNAEKYGGVIGLTNALAFVRDPVARVVSHFRHAARHHGFRGEFMEYVRQKWFANTQHQALSCLDPALFGIIGVTEHYADSIKLINHRWNWNLTERKDLVGDALGGVIVFPDDSEVEQILLLNKLDVELYARALIVFNNAQVCMQQGAAYEPRGGISRADGRHGVSGWAFKLNSGAAAEVEVVVNGSVRSELTAVEFDARLAGWKVPRNGYVGFHVRNLDLDPGDSVVIRDTASGLTLDSKVVPTGLD